MEPIEQLSVILPTVTDVVDRVEPDQLAEPTPCREFAVRDVLDHMIVLGSSFAYGFRGEPAPEIEAPPANGEVPTAAFREAMRSLLEAAQSPGAMERTVATPNGAMPGSTFARFVAFDGLVHGWDLASATGQEYDLPPAVVEAVDAFARAAITPEMRDGDTFAEPTAAPEHATAIERLVAFSGRTL